MAAGDGERDWHLTWDVSKADGRELEKCEKEMGDYGTREWNTRVWNTRVWNTRVWKMDLKREGD